MIVITDGGVFVELSIKVILTGIFLSEGSRIELGDEKAVIGVNDGLKVVVVGEGPREVVWIVVGEGRIEPKGIFNDGLTSALREDEVILYVLEFLLVGPDQIDIFEIPKSVLWEKWNNIGGIKALEIRVIITEALILDIVQQCAIEFLCAFLKWKSFKQFIRGQEGKA